MDLWAVRFLFVAILCLSALFVRPFGLDSWWQAAAAGAGLGVAMVLVELRLRKASLKQLIGAATGGLFGVVAALLIGLALDLSDPFPARTVSFLQVALLVLMLYVGLLVGAGKSEALNLGTVGGWLGTDTAPRKSSKILDTSVIIDGRIADICETGFLDGPVVIPQFVLRELQLVADSSDTLKRNRGRRGLDVLQRIQKMANLDVQIVEQDFPRVRDVDMKLIELAKLHDGKIVTNDFNLNKVAQLHGVAVLNINELTNALKPIVLPGEIMRVFILKEGKEYNQGVAYLDDGTMVVVDNARRMISKTIDMAVTSVLQTTAGKMIFGKYDERAQHTPPTQGPERAPGDREKTGPGSRETGHGAAAAAGQSGGREHPQTVTTK